MYNRNWNNPRMGMRGPGPGMWRPPQQQPSMHRPPPPRPHPLIRPGGTFNPQAILAADESRGLHSAVPRGPPQPPPQHQEMMKIATLQSQAAQYQKLMQQQYHQYNSQMAQYQEQMEEWQQQTKTEQSNTPLKELHERRDMFVKQLVDWETQFNSWREEHSKHPDKEQFKRYQDQWQQWQVQMKNALVEIEKQIKEREQDNLNKQQPPVAMPANSMAGPMPGNNFAPGNVGPRGPPPPGGIRPGMNPNMGPHGHDMGSHGSNLRMQGLPHAGNRFQSPGDAHFRPDIPGNMERFRGPPPDGPLGPGGPRMGGMRGMAPNGLGGVRPGMGGPDGPGRMGPRMGGPDMPGRIGFGRGGFDGPNGMGRGDGPSGMDRGRNAPQSLDMERGRFNGPARHLGGPPGHIGGPPGHIGGPQGHLGGSPARFDGPPGRFDGPRGRFDRPLPSEGGPLRSGLGGPFQPRGPAGGISQMPFGDQAGRPDNNTPNITRTKTPPPGISPTHDQSPEPMDLDPPGASPPHPSSSKPPPDAAQQLQMLRQQQEQLMKLQKMQEMSDKQRSSNQTEAQKPKGYPKPMQPPKPTHSAITKQKLEENKPTPSKGYPKPNQPPKHLIQTQAKETEKPQAGDKKETEKPTAYDKKETEKPTAGDKTETEKSQAGKKGYPKPKQPPKHITLSGYAKGSEEKSKESLKESTKTGDKESKVTITDTSKVAEKPQGAGAATASDEEKKTDVKEIEKKETKKKADDDDDDVIIEEVRPAAKDSDTKSDENEADGKESEELKPNEDESDTAEAVKKSTATKESPFAKKPLSKEVDKFGRIKRSSSPSNRFGRNSSTRRYRGREASKSRSRSRSKSKEKTRPRSRERSRDKSSRARSRERSREQSKPKFSWRSRSHSRERSKVRSRSRERSRDRSRARSRERSRKRSRSRSREASRAKKTDRGWQNVETEKKVDRYGRPYEGIKKDRDQDKPSSRSPPRSRAKDEKEPVKEGNATGSVIAKDLERLRREEDLLRDKLASERLERIERERLLSRYAVEEKVRIEERLRAERLLLDRRLDDPLADRLRDDYRSDRLRDDPRYSRLRDPYDRPLDDPRDRPYGDRFRDDYRREGPSRSEAWYRDREPDRYRLEARYRADDRYRGPEADRWRHPEDPDRERLLRERRGIGARSYENQGAEADLPEGGRMEGGRMVFDYSSGTQSREPAAGGGSDQSKPGLSQAAKIESIDYGHGQSVPVEKELQGEEFKKEVVADVIGSGSKAAAAVGGAEKIPPFNRDRDFNKDRPYDDWNRADSDRNRPFDDRNRPFDDFGYNKGPDLDRGPGLDRGPEFDRGRDFDRWPEFDRRRDFSRGLEFDKGRDFDRGPEFDRGRDVDRRGEFDRGWNYDRGGEFDRGEEFDREGNLSRGGELDRRGNFGIEGSEFDRGHMDSEGPGQDSNQDQPTEEDISTNFPDEEEREEWDPFGKKISKPSSLPRQQQDQFRREPGNLGPGQSDQRFGYDQGSDYDYNRERDLNRAQGDFGRGQDLGRGPDFDRGRNFGRGDYDSPSRDYPQRDDFDQPGYHIPPAGPADYHDRDKFRPSDDYYDLTVGFEGPGTHQKTGLPKDNPIAQCISIDDILNKPGRQTRPKKVVILMRGPPGSGKTYVSRLIKEKEMQNGGATPRMLCLDDYFSVEVEKMEVDPETKKKVKVKVQQYEFEEEMESIYQASLLKSFKKTVDDGFFDFIIVDAINHKLSQFEGFLSYGKNKGFECYIAELMAESIVCLKRNIHNRTQEDIQQVIDAWEAAPVQYTRLDVRSLLQDDAITEVEMEDFDPEAEAAKVAESQEEEEEAGLAKSRWEVFTEEKLEQLDGVRSYGKRKQSQSDDDIPAQSFEEYFNLNEVNQPELRPGEKRVRWADIEERKDQSRKRALGFVVGQTATDWAKITDDNYADKALNRTKYF